MSSKHKRVNNYVKYGVKARQKGKKNYPRSSHIHINVDRIPTPHPPTAQRATPTTAHPTATATPSTTTPPTPSARRRALSAALFTDPELVLPSC